MIKETSNTTTVPQLVYRFEIIGADGTTYPVVISEDGSFVGDSACADAVEYQLDAQPQH